MTCTICEESNASWEERPRDDRWHLECASCGSVDFTDVAYTQLGNVDAGDRGLLARFFAQSKGAVPVITCTSLGHLLEKLRAARDAELLGAELNRSENK